MSNEEVLAKLEAAFTEKYGIVLESATYEMSVCEFCNSPYTCRVKLVVDGTNRTGRSTHQFNDEGEAIISAFEEAIQPKYTIGGMIK
jgi:hypothetical protein